MIATTEAPWSTTELSAAHHLIDLAYQREISTVLATVQQQAATLDESEALWQLHDFLSTKRHEIDGKYDRRDSVKIFTFAQLLKEGWISLDELDFLSDAKRSKIKVLSRM